MDFSKEDFLFLIYLTCSILLNTEALNECGSNPCRNGATCVDGPYGFYTCLCTESWHGQNCDIEQTTYYPCESGNFYNYTGTILSDNYPNALPNRLNCFLLIRIHGAETINMTFNMFDLEEERDAVFFGYGYDVPSNGSYDKVWTNGRSPPDVFSFHGPAAWMMVETNKVIQSQGFNLSISADGNDCINRQCPIGVCEDLIRDYTCPCYLTCHNGGVCNLQGGCDCPQNISTGVSCESVLCEVPDYPAHLVEAGMPTEATSCSPGALILQDGTCLFECEQGYTLEGDPTARCGSDRQLSPLPTCHVACDIPTPSEYLEGRCLDMAYIIAGQTCTFGCPEGYILTGESTVTCGPGGGLLTLPDCQEMSNDEVSSTKSYDDYNNDYEDDVNGDDIDSDEEMTTMKTTNTVPTMRDSEGLTTMEVVGIAGGILGFIIVINLLIIIVCCRPSCPRKLPNHVNPIISISTSPGNVAENRNIPSAKGLSPVPKPAAKPLLSDKYKFPVDRLLGLHLSKNLIDGGSFGRIYRVEAVGIIDHQDRTTVAVKMLRDSATDLEKNNFLNELQIMKEIICHPNIIRLLGYSIDKDGSIYIIMEYCPNQSLRHYLTRLARKDRQSIANVSSEQLLRFGVQIAKAMEHLAKEKIVHRDLAARNVLLGSRLECKVADFGLARRVDDDEEYIMMSRVRVPVRWLALESLRHNVYSTKSDVWSFAVLLWEILTLGARPYTGMTSQQVKCAVEVGYRLPKPDHCSRSLYNLMLECWKEDPTERPSFSEIRVRLENMLTTASSNIIMNDFDGTDYEYVPMADLIDEDEMDNGLPQDDMVTTKKL